MSNDARPDRHPSPALIRCPPPRSSSWSALPRVMQTPVAQSVGQGTDTVDPVVGSAVKAHVFARSREERRAAPLFALLVAAVARRPRVGLLRHPRGRTVSLAAMCPGQSADAEVLGLPGLSSGAGLACAAGLRYEPAPIGSPSQGRPAKDPGL
jgi:hypothetical protein